VRESSQAGETVEDGIAVHRLRAGYPDRWRSWISLWNPQTVPEVGRLLRAMRPDVVHAHNLHHHLSYQCLSLAKGTGAKVFLTAHDAMLFHYGKLSEFIDPSKPACLPHPDYRVTAWQQIREYRFYYNPIRNAVIRRSLKNVDGIFAVSDALKEALERNGIAGAEVLHNGIDADRWLERPTETEAFVSGHGLSGRRVVLCSGRMNASKGLDKLIEAMRIVKRTMPEAMLVVGGGKEFGRRTDTKADDAVFTDWLAPEAMRSAIHASAVVAVPSIYLDPFPTTTLEAMACGKPVVSGCLGGSKEAVTDGVTGFVVDPFDVSALADRILKLLADRTLAARRGAAGLARIRAEFSLQGQVEATLRRYRSASRGTG
jgi:glycosyltransferase involved in cell wall biosynthesis